VLLHPVVTIAQYNKTISRTSCWKTRCGALWYSYGVLI